MALEIAGLTVAFNDVTVLDRLDLSVAPGEVVGVMGPSGSGKSTLLAAISGLLVPDAGVVKVAGIEMTGLGLRQSADLRRRKIGQIFQEPTLIPELSVAENVAVTLIFDGVSRSHALARATELLDLLDVGAHASKSPDRISGGQAQRVALARALAGAEVELLVADEPTASLDVKNAMRAGQVLIEAAKRRDVGLILATHDPAIGELCDRLVDLRALRFVG